MGRLLIFLLVGTSFFISCYTQKKAVNDIHKAMDKFPDTTQRILRTWKPCIETARDTAFVRDTTWNSVMVQCPDTIAYRIDSFETNTAVRFPYKVPVYVKVPLPQIRETRTITIREKDMADVDICMTKNQLLEKSFSKIKAWNKAGWGVAIVLAILFLLSLLIKKK